MNANLKAQPNVKIVRDSQGKFWYCDAGSTSSADLRGQGCVLADEWHYDRMFGG
jgi:hypothetical protein